MDIEVRTDRAPEGGGRARGCGGGTLLQGWLVFPFAAALASRGLRVLCCRQSIGTEARSEGPGHSADRLASMPSPSSDLPVPVRTSCWGLSCTVGVTET